MTVRKRPSPNVHYLSFSRALHRHGYRSLKTEERTKKPVRAAHRSPWICVVDLLLGHPEGWPFNSAIAPRGDGTRTMDNVFQSKDCERLVLCQSGDEEAPPTLALQYREAPRKGHGLAVAVRQST